VRNMSFALTTTQVRARTKTVTRRLGWKTLKPGTLIQPVVKGMGLKKGETVEKIGGPIRITQVSRETVGEGLSLSDRRREGIPQMSADEFIDMFCRHNGCARDAIVTRIEFEYVEEA
jgi:hypothetical protein